MGTQKARGMTWVNLLYLASKFYLQKLTWEEGSAEMDGWVEMDGFSEGIAVGHCDTLLM